ncbi:integral membrane protein [Colletotrichum salicis]|uniref:Integral membrane protein n=1 Tax=Colletotrichum salicis TaxID=1209931 RepID=A0A135UPU8_9PEZI|nr:integral membrane protein [Colletotrichum salicis]
MAGPPDGQGRFEAGTITIGALALGGTLTSLSIIFVCLRAFTRLSLVRRGLGPDDYLIGISLALAIIFYGLSVKLCELGVGTHLWQVERADYSPSFLLHSIVAIAVYSLSATTAKLSLLVLYLRLSPETWFRIVTMTLIGFAFSATNIIMDVVCLVLPLKIIIPLQMVARQKLSLILLFATGGLVCICAIRRTILTPPLFKSTDYTFDTDKQLNWASFEVNAGVVCASVPALKPFFVRYLPMFVISHITARGSKSKKTNPNYQNYQNSNPYSTTIEANKRRRNVQSEAYELRSRDDLSLSSNDMPKNGSREDVVKLWSGNAFRKDSKSHRETIIESNPRDPNDSGSTIIDEIQPVAENNSRGDPPQRVASMSEIMVITETRVEYEVPWPDHRSPRK